MMKRLLDDLDLVIAQIVQYSTHGTNNPDELDLIEQSINKRGVITQAARHPSRPEIFRRAPEEPTMKTTMYIRLQHRAGASALRDAANERNARSRSATSWRVDRRIRQTRSTASDAARSMTTTIAVARRCSSRLSTDIPIRDSAGDALYWRAWALYHLGVGPAEQGGSRRRARRDRSAAASPTPRRRPCRTHARCAPSIRSAQAGLGRCQRRRRHRDRGQELEPAAIRAPVRAPTKRCVWPRSRVS